jgi:hypothetical protein
MIQEIQIVENERSSETLNLDNFLSKFCKLISELTEEQKEIIINKINDIIQLIEKKDIESLKDYFKSDLFDSNDFSVMIGDQYANSLLMLKFWKAYFEQNIDEDFSILKDKMDNHEQFTKWVLDIYARKIMKSLDNNPILN